MMWKLGRQAVTDHPNDPSIRKVYRTLRRELRRPGNRVDIALMWASLLHLYPDLSTMETHAQANWEAIQRRIAAYEAERGRIDRRKTRRIRRPLMVAAILIFAMLLAAAITQAAGIDIWRYFIRWMDERAIVTITQEVHEADNVKPAPNASTAWGDEFLEALDRNGLYPALPKWLPEGYKVDSIVEDSNDWLTAIIGSYSDGANVLQIDISTYTEASMIQDNYERDNGYKEAYFNHGKTFYLTTNIEQSVAFWIDEPYTIMITGNLNLTELKRMIDSINSEE